MRDPFVTALRRRATAPVLAALVTIGMVAIVHVAQAQTAAAADVAEADVRKVDRDPPRLTLRHGEIKSLDMPPMTMVFRVSSPDLLDRLKPGDRVRFRAEKIGGHYTVTWIEAAP